MGNTKEICHKPKSVECVWCHEVGKGSALGIEEDICDVIKQNESELANIYFKIQ